MTTVLSHRFLQFLFGGYIFVILLLFIYTFTQVDLGLTLSQFSIWQTLQRSLQHIGYFQRPLSTAIYILILLLLFSFYLIFLSLARKGALSYGFVWKLIVTVAVILTFSYNAFSYDLFNYIFDAKIVTYYHQNPYEHKALDFPTDPMLSFMHWTHRTYPYGPSWLFLTVPLSFLGFGYFIVTFFLFKLLMTAAFLGSVLMIEKSVKLLKMGNGVFHIVLFALNPLVLIESLVSAHNDIVMIFFALLAFYLLLKDRFVFSYLSLLFSIGVKFATVFLLPVVLLKHILKREKFFAEIERTLTAGIVLMTIAILIATERTNFQPWYLLFVMPFAALVGYRFSIQFPFIIISFFATLLYVPYLYFGHWNPPIPVFLDTVMVLALEISAVVVIVKWYSLRRSKIAKPHKTERETRLNF